MNEPMTKDILARLSRLEEAVFSDSRPPSRKAPRKGSARSRGPAQGIRILLDEGFFSNKQRLAEVRTELANKGYHYTTQAIDTALRRMATRKGPLVVLKESGVNSYAERR